MSEKKHGGMDKHSGTGYRGDPKKEGAGGKGTWGKAGENYEDDELVLDKKDPLYEEPSNEEQTEEVEEKTRTLDEYEAGK